MYKVFIKLLDENNSKAADVSKATGIPASTFSDWKSGKSVPKRDKLDLIANYFKISPQIFKNPNPKGYCYSCGLKYEPDHQTDMLTHRSTHKAWEDAVERFGFCWTYEVRENAKSIARNKLTKEGLPLDEKVELNIEIFRALFSRSLDASGFSLDHVDFPAYVSMLLNQNHFKDIIDHETYSALVNQFGISNGIDEGKSYYEISPMSHVLYVAEETSSYTTVAAHKENNASWTDEELKKIEEYKQLLLDARKNKK